MCDHNSAPPAHQYITTDKTNILIRALTLKRSKDELAGRLASGASASGASRGPGARPPAPAVGAPSASASAAGEDAPKLETLSADELRAFLRARGVTGAAVAIAGKAALLSQARLAAAKPIVHPPNGAR